jgi:hypothetical protein
MQKRGDFRFHPTCPNSRTGPFSAEAASAAAAGDYSVYDFDAVSDAIRITVTGVIDFPVVNSSLESFAGYSAQDPGRLLCSVSSVITQSEPPARYVKSVSEVLSLRSAGLSLVDKTSQRKVLSSLDGLWIGNYSFAVHPLNLSVYLLGAGNLSRYAQCGGIPFDCKLSDSDGDSVLLPDDVGVEIAGSETKAKEEFSFAEGNIYKFIFYDQRSTTDGEVKPEIYLGSQNLCGIVKTIRNPDETLTVQPLDGTTTTTGSRVYAAFGDYAQTVACTQDSGLGGSSVGEVKGAFFDPSGGDGFVLTLGQDGYGVYRALDWQRGNAVMRLTSQFEKLSK